MTLEYLEIMEDVMNETREAGGRVRVKVRGTATFIKEDGEVRDFEFVGQQPGVPVQRSVKKRGESRFYETEGEKQSSYVAHLKVAKDATDPVAEMQEQLDYFTRSMRKTEQKPPRSKALLDKPGVTVWHRQKEHKVIVRMEIMTDTGQELSGQLFNLTSEVNKCFAINRVSLSRQSR